MSERLDTAPEPEHPDATVVVLTGDIDKARLDATRALGSVGVVMKPFKGSELVEELDRAIAVKDGSFDDPPTSQQLTLSGPAIEELMSDLEKASRE